MGTFAEKIQGLTDIHLSGKHLLKELKLQCAQADAELKFLQDTHEVPALSAKLRANQDILRPILNARKSMADFRRDTHEMALAELSKHLEEISCEQCGGTGHRHALLSRVNPEKWGERGQWEEYGTCKICGGSGVKE